MKGWIDRVFTPGWAYGTSDDPGQNKLLGRFPVQLIGVGVSLEGVYQRRGYRRAMETQTDRGIFDYRGARVKGSYLLLPDATSGKVDIETACGIGARLFDM